MLYSVGRGPPTLLKGSHVDPADLIEKSLLVAVLVYLLIQFINDKIHGSAEVERAVAAAEDNRKQAESWREIALAEKEISRDKDRTIETLADSGKLSIAIAEAVTRVVKNVPQEN